MLYEYLITVYKIIVGLITPELLISVALGTFGFYLIWICVALACSFQRKFNSKCHSLVGDIRKNRISSANVREIDERIEKISGGFYHGWRKFKNSSNGKPSDYITRRESLDVEINGGALNQGKSIMRAFITLATFVIFLLNIAYIGNEKTVTFLVLAESMVLPFVFHVVMKLFYFLQSSLKQRLYKLSVESFYECIDLLDDMFGAATARDLSASLPENVVIQESIAVVPDGPAPDIEESVEKKEGENEQGEALENAEPSEESEDEGSLLDKYDVFKKKNIDIDKLMNETPKSGTTLPYIDVDSDYVIKDDEEVGAKIVTDNDNATSILGGMMQNTSGLKKGGSSFIDVDKEVAQIDDEKLDELKKTEEEKQDSFEDAFKAFEVNQEEAKVEETPADETPLEEPASIEEAVEEAVENIIEEPVVEEVIEPVVPVVPQEPEETAEERAAQEASNIANVVSGFKANRSKLATGGVIIERNEPIARRERHDVNLTESSLVEELNPGYNQPEIIRPNADVDADAILNSVKSSAGGYDPYAQYNPQPQSYGVPEYSQPYNYGSMPNTYNQPVQNTGYGDMQGYQGYNQTGYGMNNYSGYSQPQQSAYGAEQYQDYNANIDDDGDGEMFEEVLEEETPKTKTVRTKENEPRPRNLKSKPTKQPVKEEPMEKRGRPRKQEVSETMTIKSDKEFDEVLARAEKLMRKSEEGLSESQSKRIEKELKMLMDAMNRYKESK